MTGNACILWARGGARASSRPRDGFAGADRLTAGSVPKSPATLGPRRGRPGRSILSTALLLASVAFLAGSVLSAHAGGGAGGGGTGGAGGADNPTGAGGAGVDGTGIGGGGGGGAGDTRRRWRP